jgi:hypothetical protein
LAAVEVEVLAVVVPLGHCGQAASAALLVVNQSGLSTLDS